MSRSLYYGDPINRADPLNRGLVSRWQVVPWYASGPRWIDLAGRNHGTLTNGPVWQGSQGRPGGWGALSFDGTDDYASTAGPNVTSALSVSWWMLVDAAYSVNTHIFGFYQVGGAFAGWGIRLGNASEINIWDGGDWRTPSVACFSTGVWQHFVVTHSGSAAAFYLNGSLLGTGGGSSIGSYTGSKALGARADGASNSKVILDDARIYSRVLPDTDAHALWIDSQQGSPRTLRRLPQRTWFVQVGGGGATVPTPYYYRFLQGGGSL